MRSLLSDALGGGQLQAVTIPGSEEGQTVTITVDKIVDSVATGLKTENLPEDLSLSLVQNFGQQLGASNPKLNVATADGKVVSIKQEEGTESEGGEKEKGPSEEGGSGGGGGESKMEIPYLSWEEILQRPPRNIFELRDYSYVLLTNYFLTYLKREERLLCTWLVQQAVTRKTFRTFQELLAYLDVMITTVNTYRLNGLVPDAIWGYMLGGPIPDSLLHSWGQYKGVDVKLYHPLRRMVEEFAKTLETNSLIATSGPVSYRLMKDLVEMATHITGVGQQSQNVLFFGPAHVPPRGHSCSPAPAGPRKQEKTGGSGSPGGRSDGDNLRPSKPTNNCPHRWKRENQQFWGVKKEGSKYFCKRYGRSDGVTSAGHTSLPYVTAPTMI